MTILDAPDASMRRRRNLWLVSIGVVLAAVVGVIAVLGGFNEVPIEKLPVIQLGDTYSGNEVDTQITGTYLTNTQPRQTFDADEGEQYFVVQATLLNTTATPDVLDTGLVRILLGEDVAPEDEPYNVVNADNGFSLDFLQPGLEVHALYFWVIPDKVDDGTDVIVGVLERHEIDDARYGGKVYSRGEPIARIVTTIGAQL